MTTSAAPVGPAGPVAFGKVPRLWPGGGRDVRVAVVTFAAGLVLIMLGLTGLWQVPGLTVTGSAPGWWFVPPLVVGCLATVAKRRAPAAALAVGAAAFCVDTLLGGSIAGFLYLLDLLYHAALLGSPRLRRFLWAAAAVLVAGPVFAALLAASELRVAVLIGLQQAALFGGPLWWAKDVRTTTELAAVAAARADAVERLAASARREAVRAERDALARDLHDAVASHLSAIALHSGAALAGAAESGRDRAALDVVRRSALESMREMHSLIALLRDPGQHDEGSEPTRPPGLADLDALVRQTERAGATIDVGTLATDTSVPAAVALAAYRIVQEALTNAGRHAPGQPVRLDVSTVGSRLAIDVTNARTQGHEPGAPDGDDRLGSGLGLTIMRERAAAVGGTLTATGTPDAWTVTARLPRTAQDADR